MDESEIAEFEQCAESFSMYFGLNKSVDNRFLYLVFIRLYFSTDYHGLYV